MSDKETPANPMLNMKSERHKNHDGLKSMMKGGETTTPTRKDKIQGTDRRFAQMMKRGRTRARCRAASGNAPLQVARMPPQPGMSWWTATISNINHVIDLKVMGAHNGEPDW